MKRTLSLAVLSLALFACAPVSTGAGAAGDLAPSQYERAVEVDNGASVPVVVKYYTTGGGPFYLERVGANQRKTITLPAGEVGHIFAETLDGQRFSSRTSTVRIRRVTLPTEQ